MLWKLLEPHIAPEKIGELWGFPITNTFVGTWLAIILLFIFLWWGRPKNALIPKGGQNAVEWIVEFLQGLVEGVSGKEKGKKFFPLVATFFLFILMANMIDVLPGVETFGWLAHNFHAEDGWTTAVGPFTFLFGADSNKFEPWLRPGTTDLNLTVAMAIVSVVVTQIFGFHILGAKEQLSKYFNIRAVIQKGPMGLVDVFVGLLEIVSELGRILSFSFRLFGNIFAGSVLLAVFAFLLPVLATSIFIPFEIFVGAVQAFVFAFLTLLFMEVGSTSHESHAHAEDEYHASAEHKEHVAAGH